MTITTMPLPSKIRPDKAEASIPKTHIDPSNTTYRILFFLNLLTQFDRVSLDKLNHAFMDNTLIAKAFSHETVRKYGYTLSRAGFKIQTYSKGNSIGYRLMTSPMAWPLPQAEQQAIKTILTVLAHHPIRPLYQQFIALLQHISPYYRTPDQNHLENLHKMHDTTFKPLDEFANKLLYFCNFNFSTIIN